jgi:hypothetical protein
VRESESGGRRDRPTPSSWLKSAGHRDRLRPLLLDVVARTRPRRSPPSLVCGTGPDALPEGTFDVSSTGASEHSGPSRSCRTIACSGGRTRSSMFPNMHLYTVGEGDDRHELVCRVRQVFHPGAA